MKPRLILELVYRFVFIVGMISTRSRCRSHLFQSTFCSSMMCTKVSRRCCWRSRLWSHQQCFWPQTQQEGSCRCIQSNACAQIVVAAVWLLTPTARDRALPALCSALKHLRFPSLLFPFTPFLFLAKPTVPFFPNSPWFCLTHICYEHTGMFLNSDTFFRLYKNCTSLEF